MPLKGFLDKPTKSISLTDRRRTLCEIAGVLNNPFPSVGQTSGHPHSPTDADEVVDREIVSFYHDRKSHVLAVTATQGIGKTNLLNAYEQALNDKLSGAGFFVIKYVADPDRFFDRLIVSIFEYLGEDHLRETIEKLSSLPRVKQDELLTQIRTAEVRVLIESLSKNHVEKKQAAGDQYNLAYQWLLGLPLRKSHRECLGVNFRLDTVEAKTRALRDIVYISFDCGTLQGVFLLLDELEKGDVSTSKSEILRYLQAMRALIDSLPRYLFLMVALTPDALNRYREMQPALRGRLANEVRLTPLLDEEAAIRLYEFYLGHAQDEAALAANENKWQHGKNSILSHGTAVAIYRDMLKTRTVSGVRQREYLNQLYDKAQEKIDILVS